jgi:lysozyme
MSVNQATINLIKHFESLHDGDLSKIGLQPKQDCAGIWTVGYGHALRNNNGAYLRGAKDKAGPPATTCALKNPAPKRCWRKT